MDNLSLDPIKINTELAEEYLKAHNNFEDWPLPGKYWHINKYPKEKEEYTEKVIPERECFPNDFPKSFAKAHLGRELAQKIEENELLFSQLEYIIRKTDDVDVKNNIKLISQHLKCCDLSLWNPDFLDTMPIIMDEKKPLYALGCAAIALYGNTKVNIVTNQKMAPLCHLFFDLCAELGWKIPLIFAHDTEKCVKYLYNDIQHVSESTEFGCTGVITESADIDSALDLFINSSVAAPWKLQRIFVQESVYDDVKGALAWKCTREQVDCCADAFAIRGKLFLCDVLSAERGEAARVPVEAYRTAAEARALLSRHPTRCLSVWAADAAHAHELALPAPAALVWINDYAAFDGPPKSSLPVFETMYHTPSRLVSAACLKDVSQLRFAWSKLAENKRVDVIMKALQEFRSTESEGSDEAEVLQHAIQKGLEDSFASVKGGRIWFGVERPHVDDVTSIEVFSSLAVFKVINTAIKGGAVVYFNNLNSQFKCILAFLWGAGVPVSKSKQTNVDGLKIKHELLYRKLKVVSTNFGTIFAN